MNEQKEYFVLKIIFSYNIFYKELIQSIRSITEKINVDIQYVVYRKNNGHIHLTIVSYVAINPQIFYKLIKYSLTVVSISKYNDLAPVYEVVLDTLFKINTLKSIDAFVCLHEEEIIEKAIKTFLKSNKINNHQHFSSLISDKMVQYIDISETQKLQNQNISINQNSPNVNDQIDHEGAESNKSMLAHLIDNKIAVTSCAIVITIPIIAYILFNTI